MATNGISDRNLILLELLHGGINFEFNFQLPVSIKMRVSHRVHLKCFGAMEM